jgi:hypothetical protein
MSFALFESLLDELVADSDANLDPDVVYQIQSPVYVLK